MVEDSVTPNLSVNLAGVQLPNPLVLASGILGTTAPLMARVGRCGAGAVTSKSCGLEARAGHRNPTVLDWGPGLINAVGLANPGVDDEVEILAEARRRLHALGVPLVASVFADSVAGFARVVQRVCEAGPDLVELNISCPNVHEEFGRPFALDPAAAADVTRAARAVCDRPMFVKLSPNVTDIVAIGCSVANAGADGLTAINTLGPGMVIDVESGWPILANRVGGVSGPAIRPIAVRIVYDLAAALDLPIIGVGGVSCARDVVEMLMAGAHAVGIGSAVVDGGPALFGRIRDDLERFMREHGYMSIEEMRGLAHDRR
jgi:dihydroorotate dehydrogenase (NAD+) catalytic subunit